MSTLLLLCNGASAQARSSYGEQIYDAYINGNMDKWNAVIKNMESSPLENSDEKLELIGYYYGHTGYLIGIGDKETAKKYIERADKLIGEVLAEQPENATAWAYKGTFTGYRMSINKIKVPVLGPRTMKYIRKAYETDPDNVQALSDMGNMLYYAPSMFGGDKTAGIRYIEKAIRRMEALGTAENNWYYLNLLVMLAQYSRETGDPQKALLAYEKALAAEPGFKMVRDELYPDLQHQMQPI